MPYGSARDLPVVIEMEAQIRALAPLRFVLSKEKREELNGARAGIRSLVETVDSFYDLLGPRNWIFHDRLHLKEMEALVAAHRGDPAGAEEAFIAWYRQEGRLSWLLLPLRRHEPLRARMHLLEYALEDYNAGRYYAVVQTLLSVMDGLVNDLNPEARQGLHALEPEELEAWNSVVGHHQGLASAHVSFKKTFKKRCDEPIEELYRHGIVHGALTNYNNDVVATKAWNRLFALDDWIRAREAQERAAAAPPDPTWRELGAQLAKNARDKKALDAFVPARLAQDDQGFAEHPAYNLVATFMNAWHQKNYGTMAKCVTVRGSSPRPVELRREYQESELTEFEILEVDHQANSVALVRARLSTDSGTFAPQIQCLLTEPDGSAAISVEEGRWGLPFWQHSMMLRNDSE